MENDSVSKALKWRPSTPHYNNNSKYDVRKFDIINITNHMPNLGCYSPSLLSLNQTPKVICLKELINSKCVEVPNKLFYHILNNVGKVGYDESSKSYPMLDVKI